MYSEKYQKLLKIIYAELGQKVGDVFDDFYKTDAFVEQLKSAYEFLSRTIGKKRATELLKEI